MSIYTKPLLQLGPADLEELLTDKSAENVRLEFKSEVPKKDDTLKKLSSFANTFGGFMVIGAKAKSEDGRIEDLPGVNEESGYRQKVVDWCFTGASPPLIVQVSDPIPAPSGNGKVCYVIHAAESEVAPHFLNGRKGVWVRTDEFSSRFEAQLANDNELRHMLDRRKLIRERRTSLLDRAKRRFGTYAGRAREPRLELCVVPRFPARPLCGQERLSPLVCQKRLIWRGLGFPIPGSGAISQHESTILLKAAGDGSMVEANVWGMIFYCSKIADKHGGSDPIYGIHLYQFVGTTLLFIRHADTILHELGYVGPIHVQVGLRFLRDVPWLYGRPDTSGIFVNKMESQLDDELEFALATTVEDLREKLDEIVRKVLSYVFFAVNWPDLIDTDAKLQDLIRMGYRYNSWA
jgi:hypothetical protein